MGAGLDLIAPVNPSFIYPCGNVHVLAQILKTILADAALLTKYGRAARKRMETWSFRENVSRTVEAISRAVARLDRGSRTKIPESDSLC